MPPTPFNSILIANRGEIAVRIIRSARALGYRTVAVFSPVDADAPHVALADEAVALAGNEPARSYLDIEQLIAAAARSGADAVHPGYGFLAENEAFARACTEAGLVWIGPAAESIRLMGNKREAKALMEAAGVPVIPGARGTAQDSESLLAAARELGCPVMVKAAAGGGGKGMRLVTSEDDLAAAIRSAASEAKSSFGNAELIIEKAICGARHVEIQVFADRHGQVIHLGERDCSMQRRHQKIIEECPSPAVDAELRQRMGQAAIKAASAIVYEGAGTVEFLLDDEHNFYFLEMNTRLQVEHPVTELVTGHDLVAWQLQIAAGQPLPVSQDEVRWSGHAIEARLYAEAPGQGFMPQSGPLLRWVPPAGEGVRVDAGINEGQVVTPNYDPLIAKIVAHGPDRETARRRLLRALEQTVALGVRTNRAWLVRALAHPACLDGQITTDFVKQHGDVVGQESVDTERLAAVVAWLGGAGSSNDAVLGGRGRVRRLNLAVDAGTGVDEMNIRLSAGDGGWSLAGLPEELVVETLAEDTGSLTYRITGRMRRLALVKSGRTCWVADENGDLELIDQTLAAPLVEDQVGEGRIVAPMDGTVVEVCVAPGDAINRGSAVVVMEAMKMETTLSADCDGVVGSLSLKPGNSVRKGQVLATIEQVDDAD